MEFVTQSVRRYDAGTKLPAAFPALEARQIDWYQGSVHLTAAGPGVGKSIFGLNHALKIKVPTLYLSADTPRSVTTTRLVQSLLGVHAEEAKSMLDDESQSLMDRLAKEDWLTINYNAGPSMQDIGDMMLAYGEIHGYYPRLLIVDNLVNVFHGMESPFLGEKQIMTGLDYIAKELGVCVHVLTHVSGQYKDGDVPIPQGGIMNKITELPHSVLTLTRTELPTQLMVACVKNRTGPSDSSGQTRYALHLSADTMRVTDQ